MRLSVFFGTDKIGSLDMALNEPFYGFTYDSRYLASPQAIPISLSLPLTEARFSGAQTQPYFEGLLPEGEARDAIARRLKISRNSSVKLLRALGRDCAGDISIIEERAGAEQKYIPAPENDMHRYIPLEGGLFRIAENPYEEIVRIQEETRLSLAGGQEKIALYHKQGAPVEEGWYIPMPGLPSTHIIKPGLLEAHYPNLTLNEFLCLRAAAACGIEAVDADILFPANPILIIQRYDRLFRSAAVDGLNKVSRIHQEDCCQACGIKSDMKYEHDGGPGFMSIRNLLVKHSRLPIEDIAMLVRLGIFNYLIGNCDAHAKNFSLLHSADGTVSLAPFYDLISTTVYDGHFGSKLSRNMGMRVGKHENIDKVKPEDFDIFAKEVRLRLRQVLNIGEELIQTLPFAFGTAGLAAENKGFLSAAPMVERILNDCNKRAKTLTPKNS